MAQKLPKVSNKIVYLSRGTDVRTHGGKEGGECSALQRIGLENVRYLALR